MADSQAGLVGLAIWGGVGALGLIAVVVFAVRGCSSAAPAAAALGTSAGAEEAKDGMHARGTDELRALGCTSAIVMDMQRALGEAGVRDGEPRYIVTCDVASGPTPSCDKAASTYFAAVAGSAVGAVNVRVSLQGTARPVCSHLYLPSGADLGEYPRLR
ncbi:MAG: hypothetical protein ACRENE_20940 [Polyangiaceae bacterium]